MSPPKKANFQKGQVHKKGLNLLLHLFFSVMHLLDQECSAANLFEEVHDNKLLEAVQLCYTETSSLVLDTLFKRYKLIEHFSAMRKYLLLGQGDLIR